MVLLVSGYPKAQNLGRVSPGLRRDKVCAPDSLSTQLLIQKFIAFVDANPKSILASTAVQMSFRAENNLQKFAGPSSSPS
jgi:hypothetical protein